MISAVIASAVFLTLSIFFREYHTIDTSVPVLYNEDFIFLNVVTELNRTIIMSCNLGRNLSYDVDQFINFAETKVKSLGYNLKINVISLDCSSSLFNISLSTDRMNITESVRLK